MRLAILGAALLVVGGVALVTGILPTEDALAVADRVWPILLFAVAITVVAELASEAGVFSAVAERTARLARGRTWLLWLLVVAIAVVSTAFLSLDTTAVLLTPVVVLVAAAHGLPPMPFALTTVWLANTASLVLPVSNLTNLLSLHALGFTDPWRFFLLLAVPSLIAIVVPCVFLFLIFRRQLTGRFVAHATGTPEDRVLFWWSAGVLIALLPLLVTGIPVWIPTVAAALLLTVVFALRRRSVLRFALIPWQLVVFASGLFLVVEAGHSLGMTSALATVAGSGTDPLSLLQLSFTGMAGSNVVNNLPAYLALEPVAGSPERIAALLIGVNAGPLITPWASLATLLWHSRLKSLGVDIRWSRYVLLGLIVAPLTVAAATVGLALVAR
ncbi:arsenical pump membrane protein [Microbacteriaceae bacterium SG_E_30_P1]|uniref:Arsenical pump membrane protein n=1 Tax=Antiquaquibacter oligotrophicus TaxID=2880260 RepID=A0ABT6KKY3_9MICO|nr:SLC13 family permease [Antiquaquibacter oligotrophicus]MDH6180113.1 arsenical pump membrane protein [Antiquaquibacter oligotrophicus]UDF14136.1 arsenic transporter [Antiquaquibacter oligotrophicus]